MGLSLRQGGGGRQAEGRLSISQTGRESASLTATSKPGVRQPSEEMFVQSVAHGGASALISLWNLNVIEAIGNTYIHIVVLKVGLEPWCSFSVHGVIVRTSM